eukprot:14840-Heterococcus_DN1.PRE.1
MSTVHVAVHIAKLDQQHVSAEQHMTNTSTAYIAAVILLTYYYEVALHHMGLMETLLPAWFHAHNYNNCQQY